MKTNQLVLILVVVVIVAGLAYYFTRSQVEEVVEKPFMIGIMTGTVAQGEDEYRAAERIIAKYGADRVIHVVYPDNFMGEQETTISQITSLAQNPDVKVIIISQAVPGALPALRKVKEVRPDILFGFVTPHEDPDMVNAEADFSIQPNEALRGKTIIAQAKKMGAKTFIHYSFPRHMSYALLAERRRILEEQCIANGIQFVFVTAPDPLAEGGLPSAQQFILEDVPRQVATYGKDTAFFSTNCGMQEPLIKAVLKAGGLFAEQCCPSPTHGYPGALGISIPQEKAGDMTYIIEQIRSEIAKQGGTGRFATWPAPVNIVATLAACDYLVSVAEGNASLGDLNTISSLAGNAAGVPVTIEKYKTDAGTMYFIVLGSIVF